MIYKESIWKRVLLVLCLFLCYPIFASQDVQPRQIVLATEIQNQLNILKQKSVSMENRLLNMTNTLMQSEEQRMEMERHSRALLNSLENTTEQLELSYQIIIDYEKQLESQQKSLDSRKEILFALLVVVIIRMCFVIVGWILAWKKVKIPFWLDILL